MTSLTYPRVILIFHAWSPNAMEKERMKQALESYPETLPAGWLGVFSSETIYKCPVPFQVIDMDRSNKGKSSRINKWIQSSDWILSMDHDLQLTEPDMFEKLDLEMRTCDDFVDMLVLNQTGLVRHHVNSQMTDDPRGLALGACAVKTKALERVSGWPNVGDYGADDALLLQKLLSHGNIILLKDMYVHHPVISNDNETEIYKSNDIRRTWKNESSRNITRLEEEMGTHVYPSPTD